MVYGLFLWILFSSTSFLIGGFPAGTLVKSGDTDIAIEQLVAGDVVHCYDAEQEHIQSVVTCSAVKKAKCVCIATEHEVIIASRDQRFYVSNKKCWEMAKKLNAGDLLLTHSPESCIIKYVHECEDVIDVYDITVKDYHNFLVSHDGVLVHNTPFVIGFTWAFGSKAIEFLGVTIGIAWLANIVLKKDDENKQSDVKIKGSELFGFGGGMFPEDPDDHKRGGEKQGGLTNQEARELAKELGYREVKDGPFNSHGKPKFQKGNQYISPDRTGHKGGVWKMFNRAGERLGTWSKYLTQLIGD